MVKPNGNICFSLISIYFYTSKTAIKEGRIEPVYLANSLKDKRERKWRKSESGLKVSFSTKVSVERIKCLKKKRIIVFKHDNLE